MPKIIFYFSGTVNSYAVANALTEKIGGERPASIMHIDASSLNKYDTVGFVIPVYYTHAPEIVIRILKQIRFDKNQRIFFVATYGASWGYALSDARQTLVKNEAIPQEFRVRMPGNYILEYGALPNTYQNFILQKAKKQIDNIGNMINSGAATKPIQANVLARMFQSNASHKRKNFGKMGADFLCDENCNSCYLCTKICPTKNITIKDCKTTWGNKCQQCMACIQWCPNNAISHPSLNIKRLGYTHPNVIAQQLWGMK